MDYKSLSNKWADFVIPIVVLMLITIAFNLPVVNPAAFKPSAIISILYSAYIFGVKVSIHKNIIPSKYFNSLGNAGSFIISFFIFYVYLVA